MLDESEVIRQGVAAFRKCIEETERFHRSYANLERDWLPTHYDVGGIQFAIVTYMQLRSEHQEDGVTIIQSAMLDFDISNPVHIEAFQVALWIYRQIQAISFKVMFCEHGEPDSCIGTKSAILNTHLEDCEALTQLPIYPHLPNNVKTQVDNAIHGYRRAYEKAVRVEEEELCRVIRSSPKHGFVYLIQSPTGSYKIGRTKDPNDRMKTFSVKLPFEVDYVALLEAADMYQLERIFHKKYAHKRINGEWFMLDAEDVEAFKAGAL